MSAQQRLKSSCVSVKAAQIFYCSQEVTFASLAIQNAIEDSDQTAGIPRLTFTPFWANSANNKFMILFLFFPENRLWHYMQIASLCQSLFSRENRDKKLQTAVYYVTEEANWSGSH